MSITRPQSRRTFLKSSAAVAAAALVRPRTGFAVAGNASQITPPLGQFGYGNVELLDGPIREQFDRNHKFYLALDEDSLLKPFRQRAGLPAPGEDMGGWYSWAPLGDLDKPGNNGFAPGHSFGQYLSGLARDYAATGDRATQKKVHRLVDGFAPAITPHFWDDNRFPAYTYDKISVGMIDAHEFAGATQAFKALDAALDSVMKYLPPDRFRVRSKMRALIRTILSAGTSRIRFLKTSFLRGSVERAIATRRWESISSLTAGIGIRWRPEKMCFRGSTPTAT